MFYLFYDLGCLLNLAHMVFILFVQVLDKFLKDLRFMLSEMDNNLLSVPGVQPLSILTHMSCSPFVFADHTVTDGA